MNEYEPSNKPICQKISCPYWSGDTRNYGCQAYQTSAGLCHLHRISGKLDDRHEYALCPGPIIQGTGKERAITGTHFLTKFELAELKAANDSFWLNSDLYKRDREFLEKCPDLAELKSWNVGEVNTNAELID